MKVIKRITEMQNMILKEKRSGKTIGFIPTMGSLHEGHLSLVRAAKKATDCVVMSIFVNPLQFGPGEDVERYPRNFSTDERLAADAGVDTVFYPTADEMYTSGHCTFVVTEHLSEVLCGASRPGHFKGVTTVVAKLFGIVKPDKAYFGQKDAQQAVIIKKMVADLNMGIDIQVMPIIREPDGFAMSSRNVYLSAQERKEALVLHESLKEAARLVAGGERDSAAVIRSMEKMIKVKPSARIDYISIVDTVDLQSLTTLRGEVLIALAVFIGKTRLIDNVIIKT